MVSSVKNHLEWGRINAKKLLDTNNSVRSDTSDKLVSLLESGEGSGIPRDQIDHFLNDLLSKKLGITTIDWNRLRTLLSIKDKIAYMTGVVYSSGKTSADEYDDIELKEKLDEIIKNLETGLLNNQEFTESWALRHAAFNRFECKLTTKEQSDLNTLANKLKKICEDANFMDLAETTHFASESNAQKIMKLMEVIKQVTAQGISIDGDLLQKFDSFEEKVKPLKDLDKSYKNLINSLNMTSAIAAKKYPSMIHISQQEKLLMILKDWKKDEQEFYLMPLSDPKVDQFERLEQKLYLLKKDPEYTTILKKHKITENQFTEWFLVYFSYKNVEKAKYDLENQKMKTFGHKIKEYESDAAKRRGNLRGRIFDIGKRMAGTQTDRHGSNKTPIDFASDEDYEVANSYFNKFQNLFYANERDAYGDTAHDKESHYLNMRNTIAAILRRRAPALCNGGHKRYGSTPRKIYKWLEWFAKGQEEKGFFKMLKKTWHHADHAEILAMVIMLQNQSSQQMLHGKNPFQHKDKWFGKIFRGMGLAEEGRQKFGETISPYSNKFLKFFEVSTKTIAKPIVSGAEAYNKGLKTYKRWKTPFYAALPATWLVAKGKDGYAATKKYLGELQGKDVNYLYESMTDAVDGVTKMGAQTVSSIGTGAYKNYQTNQQKGVLATFFELAAQDDQWKEVLQSSDLADIFNFQNRETYLFDEDGRVGMVDKVDNKETDEEKAGKELSKKLKDQLLQLQKGIDDREDLLSRKLENATNSSEQEKLLDSKNKIESRKGDIQKITTSLEKLIPLLKNPVAKETEIRTIIGTATTADTLKANYKILFDEIIKRKNEIINKKTPNLENGVTPNLDRKKDQQWIIYNAENQINTITTDKSNYDTTNTKGGSKTELNEGAKKNINNLENKKKAAEQRIFELNQELSDIISWESWLKKTNTLISTLVDDTGISHFDKNTLTALQNLDLTYYKPTSNQVTQQTNNNLANVLS